MVFEDPTRRRWRIAVASFTLLVFSGLVIFGLSAAALMTSPLLPSLKTSSNTNKTAVDQKDLIKTVSGQTSKTAPSWNHPKNSHSGINIANSLPVTIKPKQNSLTAAFLLQGDSNSIKSFTENSKNIDLIFPDWYYMTSASCNIKPAISSDVQRVLASGKVTIMPRFTDGDNQTLRQNEMQTILRSPSLQSCMAQTLANQLSAEKVYGLNVDIESLDAADDNAYLQFLATLRDALHKKGLLLSVDIPSGNSTYDANMIGKIADIVLVMMHGEHYAGSKPGAIAGQSWFESTLSHYLGIIPKNKLIVGLGSYAYDWNTSNQAPAQGITYSESISLAKEINGKPSLDPVSKNMVFGYRDEKGNSHQVWMLDAVSIWNEWQSMRNKGILGTGLWRLGAEDQNVWKFLGQSSPSSNELSILPALDKIFSPNDAEVYRIAQLPKQGHVDFKQESTGQITSAEYSTLPTGYVLERVGNAIPDKTIVLAFQDGPDPQWTPKILQTLDKNQVPGLFFVNGSDSQKYPSLVQQMASGGFLVGNQTPVYQGASPVAADKLRSDINGTQRIIESTYGSHTALFDPNLSGHIIPNTTEELNPLLTVSNLGYIFVGSRARGNLAAVSNPGSHIVMLSQKGSEGAKTVTALESLVPELKKQGYSFVSLDRAIRVEKTDLLPDFKGNEAWFAKAVAIASTARNMFWPTIFWIFMLTTTFSVARILFMSVFVIRSLRKKKHHNMDTGKKTVSILIPAYNEEKTILKTLKTLQNSTHKNFEALVIDDGSTDETSELVSGFIKTDRRFRLVTKPNGGKSTALNKGMQLAKNEIVVTIDADTILLPETIDELIKPFADPKVDAVCGNVEVGNIKNLLTGFQALEYITAQNFDRRAFDEINAISVVPGATGAWRRKRVLEIGGYESDTLTEDADLTINMLTHGGKIVYAPAAKSKTEAPEDMRDLAKQRFRWSFGTFQVLGKHADGFFKGTVGWVALPNIFVFQILFPLLAPVGDLALILSLIRGDFKVVLYGYIVFTLMDVIGSIFAFIIEKKPKQLMLLVLIQRFFYRQFLYVTIIRAIIAMLRGQRYGWNKLKRTGTVPTTKAVQG